MNKPILSIFLPSYNHSNYIIECLKSIKSIPISKDIIIIDDCSNDDSVKKIEKFILNEDLEREINFIKNTENKGVKSSLNLFLSLVKTKYVYLMASDDVVISNGVVKAIQYMEKNQKIMFTINGALNSFENGIFTDVYSRRHEDFFSLDEETRFKKIFLDYPQPILSQSTIIRTVALKEIKVWDKRLILDDFEMFIKLFQQYPNYKLDFDFIKENTVVWYRHHDKNSYKNIYRQFFMVKQVIEIMAPKSLKEKAIEHAFIRYLLMSIKYKDFTYINKSLKIISSKTFFLSFVHLPKFIIKRIFK